MDSTYLENWLCDAACEKRGPQDAPKFKDYILPLVFLKRLSDVFDDEVEHLVVNKAKRDPGEILLINASRLCAKGRPKSHLTDEHIHQNYEVYRDWQEVEGVSAVVSTTEAARNDYNLSPSRNVATDDVEPPLALEEALVLMRNWMRC